MALSPHTFASNKGKRERERNNSKVAKLKKKKSLNDESLMLDRQYGLRSQVTF
jgi:hypothetical protein